MLLTDTEYESVRAAYLELFTGQETSQVVWANGKTVSYFKKDAENLKMLIDGYEAANGTSHVRTYAKNIRRR